MGETGKGKGLAGGVERGGEEGGGESVVGVRGRGKEEGGDIPGFFC